MSQKKRGKKSKPQHKPYSSKTNTSSSSKGLVWLTLIIAAVVVVIVLGINNQNKPQSFDYNELPVMGSADAPVKIVEFGNFKCPNCKDFATAVKPQIDKDYIETGKVAFYYINYSNFLGPDAYTAALAAQAVFHQNNDAFWDYYKILFEKQQNEDTEWATPDYLVQLAKDAKLPIDYDLLRKDIDGQTYKDEVDEQNDMVTPKKVTGTPTFFINGKQYGDSFMDYNSFKKAIDKAIGK
ncbi:DsbA family protein [Paenibacillus protaetiae]|uniref:DsbA family protein n=1 Tax=Paenibacillus protaetiae TaxID=2509456 RepID=UPI001FC937D8|nr:thioredoxin domain-containing protein [Paenibacillus protaetiae]